MRKIEGMVYSERQAMYLYVCSKCGCKSRWKGRIMHKVGCPNRWKRGEK